MNVKTYVCVVSYGGFKSEEIFTSNDYLDLANQVIGNIIETQADNYPDLVKFSIPNSIDFISDYNEDDYKKFLDEIMYFLNTRGSEYKASIFELNQEIKNESIVSVEADLL